MSAAPNPAVTGNVQKLLRAPHRATEAAEPVCEAEYPQVEVGIHEVRCVKAWMYRDRKFRTKDNPEGPHKCGLEFAFIHDPDFPNVFGFLNLGDGGKPKAGRGSRYYKAWCMANGGPPRKRQVLSCRVFVDKFFRVRVEDVTKGRDDQQFAKEMVYSVVREIVAVWSNE